jgi:hypothetical protein
MNLALTVFNTRIPISATKSRQARKSSLQGKLLAAALRGNTPLAALKVSNTQIKTPLLSQALLTFVSLGAGVQAVIARSFSFIYGRNQATFGLLGITMSDEAFFSTATENSEIEIDVPERKIRVAGLEFAFTLTEMEYRLTVNRGMNEAYKRFGGVIWEKMTKKESEGKGMVSRGMEAGTVDERLSW